MGVSRSLEEQLPRPLGSYLLMRRIGEGGMGEVYLASRVGSVAAMERLSVVKMLRAQYAQDREYVTRFIDEARVVVQLSHRNICQVYEVNRAGNILFLAMEFVDGRDVADIVKRLHVAGHGAMPAPVAMHIVGEVLQALDYAHRHTDERTGEPLQLVHRDVSPKNVMVSHDGEVKLIDFGLAESRLKESTTEPDIVMGKIAYMSPEQARREPLDARADVWAAGVLLFELLAGERYYEGLTIEQIWLTVGVGQHKPKKLATFDEKTQAVLRKALHPVAAQRYESCDAFLVDLRKLQRETNRTGSASDLRDLMDLLFGEERKEIQTVLVELRRLANLADQTQEEAFAPTETVVIAQRGSTSLSAEGASSASSSLPFATPKSDLSNVMPSPGRAPKLEAPNQLGLGSVLPAPPSSSAGAPPLAVSSPGLPLDKVAAVINGAHADDQSGAASSDVFARPFAPVKAFEHAPLVTPFASTKAPVFDGPATDLVEAPATVSDVRAPSTLSGEPAPASSSRKILAAAAAVLAVAVVVAFAGRALRSDPDEPPPPPPVTVLAPTTTAEPTPSIAPTPPIPTPPITTTTTAPITTTEPTPPIATTTAPDAGVDGAGVGEAGRAEVKPSEHRGSTTPKKARPPSPPSGLADRREWLKKHCSSEKCTRSITKVDVPALDAVGLLGFKRDVDACVDVCMR